MNDATVACLGLGTMGGSMAHALIRAGFTVQAYNRSPKRAKDLQAALAQEHQTQLQIRESAFDAVQGAQFVVSCLSDDDALATVALGPKGCVARLSPNTLWIDTGTTSLELTETLHQACLHHGCSLVDAPMTGSMLGAQNATLTFMIGGSVQDTKRAQPLLEAMGKHVVHVGNKVGAGQAAKCCLNMSQAVVLQGILEGYGLAKSLGVELDKMAEIFEHSAGKTGVGTFKTPYLKEQDYRPHFRLDLMQKDLHLALQKASEQRLALPAASAVRVVYDQGVAEGWGDQDFLVLARLLERWGGFRFGG